ncbi:ABC-2 family transporter protein [Paenibacillus sp. R14(2021)]|uniref:ABC transporter permease n=1 Tax=Paenibacillus sp. R14(2021) TaxID=2859228 RepID=UPI001C61337B|nr:ABC-2 family transporter protein [Paenibacillus sp. R14(2021)]
MKALRILRAVAFVTFKEWAAYRSHMLATLLVGPVYFLVQLSIWKAVFATQDTIGGMHITEMLSYYGIAAIITYIVFDFADWNFQMLIRTGKFMTFLLRPMSHRYFALSQKVGHRTLGFLLEFIPVYLIFRFAFGISLVPERLFWTILSLLLSFMMVFFINYCVGMTAFWLTNTGGIRSIFLILRDLCAGVFVPLSFFPDAVQHVLLFLPFQFMTYVPVRVFLGDYELAGYSMSIPAIVGLQALAVAVMWGVSELIWRAGIRRFTGVGA